jgi:hypothetical protein
MDISSIANLATNMSEQATAQAVSIAVLKKALDVQANSAMQLIEAIPTASNLPSNLGQNINTSV